MKFTDKALIEALQKSGGFRSETARILGVTRSAVSNRINNSETLLEVVNDIEEDRLDIAETALMRAIESGESWAVLFYLKRKGRERGYDESEAKQEILKYELVEERFNV